MRVELSKDDRALLRTCVNGRRWSRLLRIAGWIVFFGPWLFVWPFVELDTYVLLGLPILGFLPLFAGGQKESGWFTAIKRAELSNLCHLAAVDATAFREAVKVIRVGWDENGSLEEYVDPKAVRAAEAAALQVNGALGNSVKPLNVGLIWTLVGALALVALLVLAGPLY